MLLLLLHPCLMFLSYAIVVYASTSLGTRIAKAGNKTRSLKSSTVYATTPVTHLYAVALVEA